MGSGDHEGTFLIFYAVLGNKEKEKKGGCILPTRGTGA